MLRGVDDEAALALAASKIGNRLSGFITETITGKLMPYLLTVTILLSYLPGLAFDKQDVVVYGDVAFFVLDLIVLFFMMKRKTSRYSITPRSAKASR